MKRNRTTYSGITATISAARPLGTSRSPSITRPLPPSSNARPTKPDAQPLAARELQRRDAVPERDVREQDGRGDDEAHASRQQRRHGARRRRGWRGTSSPRRCRRSAAQARSATRVLPDLDVPVSWPSARFSIPGTPQTGAWLHHEYVLTAPYSFPYVLGYPSDRAGVILCATKHSSFVATLTRRGVRTERIDRSRIGAGARSGSSLVCGMA